jgi:glutathione S-transferase
MAIVNSVIALALLQFFIFSAFVARARVKAGIEAPAMSGDTVFERYVRVHYNTMEQLVMFVPGMWLFGTYISTTAASVLGLIFLVGRVIYFRAYVAEPASRGPGFGLSVLPNLILLLGGCGGAVWSAFG